MKKGIIFSSLSTLIFIIVGYVINIWLGRRLGPESYGIYGVVITLLTTINLFQTAGLPQATSKFISSDGKKENEILRSSLVLQVISTAIITLLYFVLARPLALMLKDLSLVPYIQLSSLIFPFYGIFSLYSGYYNGMHLFKKQALINIAYSIAKLFSVIGLTYIFHLYGAITGFIVAPMIALFFGFQLPQKTTLHFPYKKLIYFSLPLIAFAFFSTLQQSIDLYFLKALLSDNKMTGFYSANQNIARIPYFALSAFSVVLFPSISKSISDKTKEKTADIISQSIRYTLIILLPLTVMFSATSTSIIHLLFSNDYLPGAASLSILLFSLSFLTVFSILSNVLNGAGYPYVTAIVSAAGVIISAMFCRFLIPVYGLNGAAIATGIGGFMAMVTVGVIVFKKFKVLIHVSSLLKIISAAVVCYLISSLINFPTLLLPLNYLISGGAYLAILIFLKELTSSDTEAVGSLVPDFISNKLWKAKN